MFQIHVFGHKLVSIEKEDVANRYAQAIREGLWQCSITSEPWIDGQHVDDASNPTGQHTCGSDCCDSRTDDEILVLKF